ncbi:ABC transporter substrate-binding protein, partial [bacterium]|nr:ABC transporter substrate-binding protein [bacterium]
MISRHQGIVLLLLVFIVPLLAMQGCGESRDGEDAIHIAFAGPLSGTGAKAGEAMRRGAQLCLDEINRAGGIRGRRVVLDLYDDRNDTTAALEAAQRIADEGRAVGVIGHNYSSCSMTAGRVYAEAGIPAVSPSASALSVTAGNDWYFRTIFNDRFQGRFMANYAIKVLGHERISIIHEDLAYGSYLAGVIRKTARELGATVRYVWPFQTGSEQLGLMMDHIVLDAKSAPDPGLLILATHAPEGVELVKRLREAGVHHPILGSYSYNSETFFKGFADLPREKAMPGYYTDGIYLTSPLIFDSEDAEAQAFLREYEARYGVEPDWRAAFAYDAALVLMEAIRNEGVTGRFDSLRTERIYVRDFLASRVRPESAVEGITGRNYFNADGDAVKPIYVGIVRNNQIVTPWVKLQTVPPLLDLTDLSRARREGRIITIDGENMYKTYVVYTGVEIKELNNWDPKTGTFDLNAYLWFRYQGDIDVENVEFANAIEPIPLAFPLEEQQQGDERYRLYHIDGTFRADFLPARFGDHVLGFRFHHTSKNRNSLIYVSDVAGMGLHGNRSYLDRLRREKVFRGSDHWSQAKVQLFQDIAVKNTLGNPSRSLTSGSMDEFSRFNLGLHIRPSNFTLRRLMSYPLAQKVFWGSVLMIVLLGVPVLLKRIHYPLRAVWFLQLIFSILLLLSVEVLLMDHFTGRWPNYRLENMQRAFDILWWVTAAFLIVSAVERFILTPVEERTGHAIPPIVRHFIAFLTYLLAGFAVIAYVFNQPITSLLATSGVFAMIIGLAIQVNIANIFSGIAINLERPFRIGDWVKIGANDEGEVVDVTWRTTRIRTRANEILSLPSSMASESVIVNYNYPDNVFWEYFPLHVGNTHL